MAADSTPEANLLQALERHQRRRAQSIPTLSALAGPPGATLSLWLQWLRSHSRPGCTSSASSELEAARDWALALTRSSHLPSLAAEHLAASAGLPHGELPARLQAATHYERDTLLQPLLAAAPPGDTTSACRALLQPHPQEPWAAVLAACEHEPLRAFAALHSLLPPGKAPALLLVASTPEHAERSARVASRLANAVPSLVVALTAPRRALEACLHRPEHQALALLREGWVEWESPTAEALAQRLQPLGLHEPHALASSLARLAEDGASEELLHAYAQAAREREALAAAQQPPPPEAVDRFRSAAERFLFQRLESLPTTAGLFEPNALLDFRLGHRRVEVDLLARSLALAVEVDGYHHFRGAEDYRRDRRKDLALQRHGYLVVRFLADDVVARLEELLATLEELVALRRAAAGPALREDAHGDDTEATEG